MGTSPYNFDPNRRRLIQQLGVGIGATFSPACGFPPTLAEQCRENPEAFRLSDNRAERDPESIRLLQSIDTVIVVMMENRSFDHLLGSLARDRDYPSRTIVNGLPENAFNLNHEGRIVRLAPMPGGGGGRINPRHDYVSIQGAWNGGLNDGFVRANPGQYQSEVMSYLTRDQIPFQYALADNFTVCDRWFSSYMGSTWPNRYYLHAGTSHGIKVNDIIGLDAPPTIWERMALKCRTVRHYAAGPVLWHTVAFPGVSLSGNTPFVPGRIEDFFADAQTGNLPEFALIDPDFKSSDGYPTHDIALSEAFLASVYRAMAESPQWSRSLLVITYDENGGYYDHVSPPTTIDPRPDFRRLGFRVPAIVIGPTVWSGKVVSKDFEHVSIASTLATRFGIDSLGIRMDHTADLSACIDPARVGAPAVARRLPQVELVGRRLNEAISHTGSQGELDASLDARDIPPEFVDPRSTEARFSSWLRIAQELEAVKVVG